MPGLEGHEPEPSRLEQLISLGLQPRSLTESEWKLKFGSDRPYDASQKFYIASNGDNLGMQVYTETMEDLGQMPRY